MTAGTGTEEYYRRRAAEYDRVYDKPERQADLAVLRARVGGLLAGRRVLEVAAGTGWWTAVLADVARSVVATDVNPEVLAVAAARRAWPTTVTFACHDAFDLAGADRPAVGGDGPGRSVGGSERAGGGTDGRFDAAFVGFFWSHVPLDRLDGFVAGLAARIGPGGRLVFVDNRYVEGSNHLVTRTDEDGNTYQARGLDDGSRWEVRKNFPAPAEIEGRLDALGGVVTITEVDHYWLAVCDLDGMLAAAGGPR